MNMSMNTRNLFVDAIRKNYASVPDTITENGMLAFSSTGNACLDFFSAAGSLRNNPQKALDLFYLAAAENAEYALRILFWLRDVRGGAGERNTFRFIVRDICRRSDSHEAFLHNDAFFRVAVAILNSVPKLGRWDDLIHCAFGTGLEYDAKSMISSALTKNDEDQALCAKWMPRKGENANKIRRFMGLTPKEYRGVLVNATNVVESDMCKNAWGDINYSHVPSVASLRYQNAFKRHDSERYSKFVEDAENGVNGAKINSGDVYPHQIVYNLGKGIGNDSANEVMWNSLPNFMSDKNILPMVDVSGSMGIFSVSSANDPIHAAVGLGLYTSMKNLGQFRNIFLTFSGNPEFVALSDDLSLRENMRLMYNSNWGYNTDIILALNEVLMFAQSNDVPNSDMPEFILILSDMQFDPGHNHESLMASMERDFENAGYSLPKVVFWNLQGNYDNTPVRVEHKNVAAISGFSPAIMKAVLSGNLDKFSPISVMLETIMTDRYELEF